MSISAVITTREKKIGVFVKYFSDYQYIKGFLKYCELAGYPSPDVSDYGWARLCQVIANYIGQNGLHIGIGPYKEMDKLSNTEGVYVIEGWNIVKRQYFHKEEKRDDSKLYEIVKEIESKQPYPLDKKKV